MTMTMARMVDFEGMEKQQAELLIAKRLVGKTPRARCMSPGAKTRLVLEIIPPKLTATTIGRKQYAKAMALLEAQKKVKVQPVVFTTGDGKKNDTARHRVHWGEVKTTLVDYEFPIELDEGGRDKENTFTTEKKMKADQWADIRVNIKRNIEEKTREASEEKTSEK